MRTAFETIVDRGRVALRSRSFCKDKHQAEPLFDAELALIRSSNFEAALVQMVEYGDQLRQRNVNFHVIGSGGSSVILYVLGMSEVNPVLHDTHFQRLWQTASGEPPILQLVVDSFGNPDFGEVAPPSCVSAHPMTLLEAIPNRVESQVEAIGTIKLDQATLASLQAGDTEGVFQFHSERAKWLLSQIRPVNIETLACVTALEQISHSFPEIMISYLERYQKIVTARCVAGRRPSADDIGMLPILFQEILMGRLRRMAKLSWNETYPFVRAAAKGQVDDQHNLWKAAVESMKDHCPENHEPLLQKIVESSRWAVCRAHHVANALTGYKAAYCRTHHRIEFERVRNQITESAEQGDNGG